MSRKSMDGWSALTRADRALIVLLLGGTLASLWWNPGASAAPAAVRIQVAGELLGEYPLADPRVIRARGPLGESVVCISAQGVAVTAAPCPRQLCRRQGRITRRGQVIVCVPNRLVVTIVGAAPATDIDALIR